MLTLDHVSVAFDRPVLRDLSLKLRKNERLCVTGASGTGKTTLLRVMAGLQKPDAGAVTSDFRVGMVFQEDRLIGGMSALNNALLATKKPDAPRARALFIEAGMENEMRQRADTLSGGQQRRVALLRAFLSDADLLLLDEPFKGLDPALRERMLALLLSECAHRAAVLVTHDQTEAAAFGGASLVIE